MKSIIICFIIASVFSCLLVSSVDAYSFDINEEGAYVLEGKTEKESKEYLTGLTEEQKEVFLNAYIDWIIDSTPRELGRQDEVLDDYADTTYREMGITAENLEVPEEYQWTRPKSKYDDMTPEELEDYLDEKYPYFEPSERQDRPHALHKTLREDWGHYDFMCSFLEEYLNSELQDALWGESITFTLYPTDDGNLFVMNDPDYNLRGYGDRAYNRGLDEALTELEYYGTIPWHEGEYTGELRQDQPHGEGTWVHTEGITYEGEFKDGYRHGEGTWTHPDGTKYIGQWEYDYEHGHGILYIDGAKYEGDFKDGNIQGNGRLEYPNGHIYDGEWENYKRHGWGVYTKPDGEKYEGEWRNDSRNGQGTYVWADGAKYVGEMKNDTLHGQGKLTLPDGRVLSGRFENNEFID